MLTEFDIYGSANVLIHEHGEDAALEATMRADAVLEKGDHEGLAVWRRILRAVGDILASECVGGLMGGHWLGHLTGANHP